MKKKLVTAVHIDELKKWWETIGKKEYQADLETTRKESRNYCSRNGHCNGGWVVGGSSGYTRLVKAANLPYDDYWSGSNPTPSTQYPTAIYRHLVALYPDYR